MGFVSNAWSDITGQTAANAAAQAQSSAAQSAAQAQARAITQAAQIQAGSVDKQIAAQQQALASQQQLAQPFMQMGLGAMSNYQQAVANQPHMQQLQQFSFNPQDLSSMPGYQFGLNQGTNAVQNSALAKGMGLSGATAQALQQFGTDYANSQWGQWYNQALSQNQAQNSVIQQNNANAMAQQQNAVSQWGGMVNMGQAAAAGQSANIGSFGANLSNIYGQSGQNQANLAMAQGQNQANMYNTLGNIEASRTQAGYGNVMNLMNMAIQAYGKTSDVRVKENIKYSGESNGYKLYEFEYKSEFKSLFGFGRYIGVIAQEVEKINPSAVITGADGIKRVFYGVIGLDMVEV